MQDDQISHYTVLEGISTATKYHDL